MLKIKLLPFSVFILVLAFSSGAGYLVHLQIEQNERLLVQEIANSHARELGHQLSRLQEATHILAHEVREFLGIPPNFTRFAKELVTYIGGISNLQLAPGGVVREIYPLAGNESAIGHDILSDQRRRPEAMVAVTSKNYALAGPFELIQGGRAVIGRLPIFLAHEGQEKFWGFVSALVYMDELLDQSGLMALEEKGYQYVLYKRIPGSSAMEIIEQSIQRLDVEESLSVSISLPDTDWQLLIQRDMSGNSSFFAFWLLSSLALALLATAFICRVLKEPERLTGIVDQTSRKLDEQNILLNSVLENINEGIVLFDSEGNLSLTNKASRRIHDKAFFEASSEQWRYQTNLYELDGVTPIEAENTALYRALNGEQVDSMSMCAVLESGKRAIIKCSGSALHDASGNKLGALVCMHDVTDIIESQRFMRYQNQILNMVMHGDDLESILISLIREIETTNPGIYLQIQLLDTLCDELAVTTEISSSAVFHDTKLSLGMVNHATPWGHAILSKQPVIVKDFSTPHEGCDFRNYAEKTGAHACCCQPVMGETGQVVGVFTMFFYRAEEITVEELALLEKSSMLAGLAIERHESSENLKKMSLAIEYSPSLVMITDFNGVIEYINPKVEEVTGYQSNEVLGKTPAMFSSGESSPEMYKNLWDTLLSGNEWYGDICNRKKNGDLFWSRQRIAPIYLKHNQISHFVSVQEDVTEARRISSEISFHAAHDMLTGLINRREFERRLERVVKTALVDKSSHALCILDLDEFKVVNDTCGHVAGDELLMQLSRLLEAQLRKRDSLARLGGDEFGILMEHCSPDQAQRAATEIVKVIESYRFQWEENAMAVSASIGLVEIHEHTLSAADTMKQADQACYVAKEMGRNQLVVYREDDELLLSRKGEMRWISEINDALEDSRLLLFAQKIVPVSDHALNECFEILLRLRAKNGTLVPPGAFLPAAERYNIAPRIDRWVIENTFAWIATHAEQLHGQYQFSINLSGLSIGKNTLADFIMDSLEKWQIEPSLIKFEITETAAISNLREASAFIRRMRQHGFHFALDDFGSGLSSFAYLKNLPVDYLKIDGMFVKDIIIDPIDEAMVRSINDIGHVMGIKTIAEFVESEQILQRLTEIGVDFAQGYGISKPFPIDRILDN